MALVTGASRGIGRATALELARAGADVALVSRARDLLDEVMAEIQGLGRKTVVAVAEASNPEQIAASVSASVETLGPIDILVNNAGTHSSGPFSSVQPNEWATVLEVNLSSAYHMCGQLPTACAPVAGGGSSISPRSPVRPVASAVRLRTRARKVE